MQRVEEKWHSNVLVMNETQLSQLFSDNRFLEYGALPSKETDIEQGYIRKIYGMDAQSSTLVRNRTGSSIVACVKVFLGRVRLKLK